MRNLVSHPLVSWAAVVIYLAVGIVLPAGAVYCQQEDGDVAVMWTGGCVSDSSCDDDNTGHSISVPDLCDSPCIDTPISPDSRNLPRRGFDLDVHAFSFIAVLDIVDSNDFMSLSHRSIQLKNEFVPPTLLSIRSVVLLI